MDQICIFRVERIQFSNDDNSEFISALHVQSSSLIAKIDQRETEVDISSLFVPRKVPSIVGFENEIDSLYQIISTNFLINLVNLVFFNCSEIKENFFFPKVTHF